MTAMTHDQLVKTIQRRMKTLGMEPLQLAAKLRGRVSQSTVYNFVAGGKPVRTNTLVAVLAALNLTIGVKENR
jgi:geranylgeranyl pyrophosphate synthase